MYKNLKEGFLGVKISACVSSCLSAWGLAYCLSCCASSNVGARSCIMYAEL